MLSDIMDMKEIYRQICNNRQIEKKIFECDRVLYLAPHPDDEVIGCGGSLLRHKNQHQKIIGCYITDGRWGLNRYVKEPLDMAKIRLKELQKVGEYLNVFPLIIWEVEDLSLSESSQLVDKMCDILLKEKPDLIYSPSIYETHQDHYYTAKILLQALSKLREINNRWFSCMAETGNIHFYSVWNDSVSNTFINITEEWKEKQYLISYYQSQLGLNIVDLAELQGRLQAVRSRRKWNYAEAFYRINYASAIEISGLIKERNHGYYV